VISSIKHHLPHVDHRHHQHHHHQHHSHHHHTPSHQSSSGRSSSEFDHARFSEHTSTHKPSHAPAVFVERPVVIDTTYPSTSTSSSEKTYTVDEFPAPVVSETKVIRETTTIIPEPISVATKSSKSSTSGTSATSLSEDKQSTAKMGKYDTQYNQYEASVYADEHGSVSDAPYRTKELIPSYKSATISSVHAPKASTFTIPCHHIRIGDLVILQHRPCQIIRITTSAQTGQHRYLGVDLFTKQLHEEPCVVSHPSPSVVLHSLLGPVFKQYRLIDIRDDGKLVAMTETGEIKQGLKVVDQGHLWSRLKEAFGRGSGSVRVLVISDHGKELAVDYKIVHLAHKL
jgi:hypothetical protein